MFDFLLEHAGELILSIVYLTCKLFGREKDAEKLKAKLDAKRKKKIAKQVKKTKKEVEKLQELENKEV